MTDPTVRALRLLSLLQTHRFWSGGKLAERLEVSARTLRRDVERLRGLGYRISAEPGAAGGYQLQAGSALPPLLVDDDEAVAIAVGLRVAAVGGLDDAERTSLSALAKLEQVLPRNLRRRVAALQEHISPVVWGEHKRVSADVLAQLALTCRDRERVRFHYTARSGEETQRLVEPHSLVAQGPRWYLIAWDVNREDWRTFRIDRLAKLHGTGVRVQPRQLPGENAAEFLKADRPGAAPQYEAMFRLHMDRRSFHTHFGAWGRDAVENAEGVMEWRVRGRTPQEVLAYMFWLPDGVEWDVCSDDDAVRAAASAFRDRLAQLAVR
ncbi:helix-turn-helix transcriptional regulator [Nesterenkonia muleiensis]|uniref:helix-turn-helix transcriptional regulator n=1 Tax=Nesterenkonia muleiensis TaxID=2282648 RepID=UPI000E71482F|nr:YafY family protein [Nesterenkonia muleiensis]